MTPVVSAIDLILTRASTVIHWSGANVVWLRMITLCGFAGCSLDTGFIA